MKDQPLEQPGQPAVEGAANRQPAAAAAQSPTPGEVAAAEEKPAYFIEIDIGGCAHCGGGRTWNVVGPGDIAESVSYDSEEQAQDLADSMNDAHTKGRSHRSAEVARLTGQLSEALKWANCGGVPTGRNCVVDGHAIYGPFVTDGGPDGTATCEFHALKAEVARMVGENAELRARLDAIPGKAYREVLDCVLRGGHDARSAIGDFALDVADTLKDRLTYCDSGAPVLDLAQIAEDLDQIRKFAVAPQGAQLESWYVLACGQIDAIAADALAKLREVTR